jgi:hypothetical protein
MAKGTVGAGLAMAAVGVGAWLATNKASATALIPTFIGIPMAGLGLFERVPLAGHYARTGTAVLALAALGGASRGVPQLAAMLRGEDVKRPIAVAAQNAVVGIAAAYLVRRVVLR